MEVRNDKNKGQVHERRPYRRKKRKSIAMKKKKEGFKRMVHNDDTNLSNKKSFTLLNTQSIK